MERVVDMDSNEWLLVDLRSGQTFVSTRKFRCPVCGWKSDSWIMGDDSRPHTEPHLVCRNGHYPNIGKFSR